MFQVKAGGMPDGVGKRSTGGLLVDGVVVNMVNHIRTEDAEVPNLSILVGVIFLIKIEVNQGLGRRDIDTQEGDDQQTDRGKGRAQAGQS